MRSALAVDGVGIIDGGRNESRAGRSWAWLLSGSMVLIVCIRFLSEDLGLFPGIVQFVDVPLTFLALLVATLDFVRNGLGPDGLKLRLILYLFVLVALVSSLTNATRVGLLPTAMFMYGFAAPLVFAAATANAGLSRESVRLVVRAFFWLGVLQLAVGIFYGLPRFLASSNPDYVSGTFGRNAYQFTYFLGVWLLYVLAGSAVESGPKRRGQGFAVGLAALAVYGLFYAAQYRAMLIFFTMVILASLWVSPARVSRRMMQTIVISAVSVVTLIAVGTSFPNLKLLQVFDLFKDSSPIVESGKVEVAANVVKMYADMPHTAIVGSGPATFSSRGYTTFSETPDPAKDAAGPLAASLMGGRQYGTDVARRYVDTISAKPIQGGTTASSPRSSYTSLAAEVGTAGLLVYLAAYLFAVVFSYRRLVASAKSGDALGSRLAFACFGGLILLLIQSLFDNWMETTRVAIPMWILVGALYALKSADETAILQTVPIAGTEPAAAIRR
ncbi:MAG: hypothetical protein A2133_08470 [Actinobacteria bacterium RBG_16_64_13]|nr:MAG: hypothetical protein A2133_08470 [Actinobacteria bacterium RBG_16_64_13]